LWRLLDDFFLLFFLLLVRLGLLDVDDQSQNIVVDAVRLPVVGLWLLLLLLLDGRRQLDAESLDVIVAGRRVEDGRGGGVGFGALLLSHRQRRHHLGWMAALILPLLLLDLTTPAQQTLLAGPARRRRCCCCGCCRDATTVATAAAAAVIGLWSVHSFDTMAAGCVV
jgi:hypothetical protein